MIIKKKVTKEQKEEVEINQTNRSRNIIKAGTGKVNALKKKALEKSRIVAMSFCEPRSCS